MLAYTVLRLTINQAGNMKVFLMPTQKDQGRKILSKGSQSLCIFARKFSRGSRVQEKVPLGFIYVPENTSEKLVLKSIISLTRLYKAVQGKAQPKDTSHIVKVGVEATC